MTASMAGDGARARSIAQIINDERQKDILRFLTCGSVDDGKSTLIGRLLYDSNFIPEDQLANVAADSRRIGGAGGDIDLALLTDGLQAEREQGITIDVAYRYFATPRRKFIVADTPGHEQYTRNMVTGASICDFAVVLADARRGLTEQTRRHACILSMMGIRKLALAVNKMDLVAYQQDRFENISADFTRFAEGLNFLSIMSVPVSALRGDNIISHSLSMDWYPGPTLMNVLETVEIDGDLSGKPLRMPVQWINRPNNDFRGFSGTVASGVLRAGDAVRILPQDRQTHVARIVTAGGDLEMAEAGDAVTLTFADEIDVGRGDVLSAVDRPPSVADQVAARLIWLGEKPMLPGRTYALKLGSQTALATITALKYKLDVNTLAHQSGRTLELNEAGVCNVSLNRPLVFDAYRENRDMGGFILIDRLTHATVGAGMIEFGLHRATNLHWQAHEVSKFARAEIKHQKPCVLWFTGLSGAGKSTVADILERLLLTHGRHTYLLDGDNVRHGLSRDLGFTDGDRVENIRRVAETAKLFVDAGLIVLVALISPFRAERQMARELFEPDEFIEVFVDAPLEVCEQRDSKGLYKKARAGLLRNFTGVDSMYEVPEQSELHLDAGGRLEADKLAETIIAELQRRQII